MFIQFKQSLNLLYITLFPSLYTREEQHGLYRLEDQIVKEFVEDEPVKNAFGIGVKISIL